MSSADEPSRAATPDPGPKGSPDAAARSRRARRWRWGGALAVLLVVAVAAFYLEENARGKSAWEEAKNKLEAEQETLNWDAYIPPAVPDDQNFYKAPKMTEWFAGRGSNELTTRLSLSTFPALAGYRASSNGPTVVTEMLLRPPESGAGGAKPTLLSEIVLDKVPVADAIRRLAGQANIKLAIDPQVTAAQTGPDGTPVPAAVVSAHWTNVTAFSALVTVLCNNNLRWVDDPDQDRVVIRTLEATNGTGANREFVLLLVRSAIGPIGEAAEGFPMSAAALAQSPPRRLSIAADSAPTKAELARLYPGTNAFQIEPTASGLRVSLNHAPVAAEDYLAWSEQSAPDFDKIREAVKRPAARLDGDYQQFFGMPFPNMYAVHVVALRLAGRAKAFLMRNQPENALRELTLLEDLRLCAEGKPSSKAMDIGTASTDVALAVIYLETVDYGLRWQVWHEPELATLVDQLGKVDLVGPTWLAIETERAGKCHLFETGTRAEMTRAFALAVEGGGSHEKLQSATKVMLRFMPRGWLYQNLAQAVMMNQKIIDSVDRLQDLVRPGRVRQADDDARAKVNSDHRSFFYFVGKDLVPSMLPNLKAAAFAQCAANEAQVVCGLERCRLARGEFPATLHELTPQFLTLVPLDPVTGEALKYRLTSPGHFLLYSVGWDEKDDNGAPLDAKGEKGDWIWDRW